MISPIAYYYPLNSLPSSELVARCTAGSGGSECSPARGPHGLKGGKLAAPLPGVIFDAPENYRWRPAPGGIHIGVNTKNFKPEMFFKKKRLRSAAYARPTVLADGKEYLIPVALLNSPNFSLPVVDRMDDRGKIYSEPRDEFADIVDLAADVWDSLNENGILEWDEEHVRDVCVQVLQVFYNLNDIEIFALGLLDRDAYGAILETLIDRASLREMAENEIAQKKTQEK